VLSSGYYDAYYKSAQKARRLIQQEYAGFFEKCDVLLLPTSPGTAFPIGARVDDPIAMYQSDILTIAANLTGIPSINIPAGLDEAGLPVGLQLMAAPFMENHLLRIAAGLAAAPGFALNYARTAGNIVQKPAIKTATRAAIPAKKVAKKVAQKAVKAPGKKVAKKVAKKATKKPAKKVAKQATKKTAKKVTKKVLKKTARRAQ
jgi:hypothetical protein